MTKTFSASDKRTLCLRLKGGGPELCGKMHCSGLPLVSLETMFLSLTVNVYVMIECWV